jgi:hypothetical protein
MDMSLFVSALTGALTLIVGPLTLIVLVVQTFIIKGQLRVMRQQSESMFLQSELISRQSAGTSGGPRLRVTRIRVTEGDLLKAGSAISGIFEIENIGGYGGEIERHCAFCVWGWPTLKPPWDYTIGIPSVTVNRIGLSKAYSQEVRFPAINSDPFTTMIKGQSDRKTLYVVGYIWWIDPYHNAAGRTYFCRKWDRERHRFVRTGDPDYESEN